MPGGRARPCGGAPIAIGGHFGGHGVRRRPLARSDPTATCALSSLCALCRGRFRASRCSLASSMRLSVLRWLDPGRSCCSAVEMRRAPIGSRFRACSCRDHRDRAALAASLALPRFLCFVPFATAGAAGSRLAAPLALSLPRRPRRVCTRCSTAAGAGCAAVAAAPLASGLVLVAVSSASPNCVAVWPATANCGSRAHGEKPTLGAVSRPSACVSPPCSKVSHCMARAQRQLRLAPPTLETLVAKMNARPGQGPETQALSQNGPLSPFVLFSY